MERPYIVCHMGVCLNGKIAGPHVKTPEKDFGRAVFTKVAFGGAEKGYDFHAFLCGRTTVEENYTHYHKPDLDPNAPPVPEGDYVAPTKLERCFFSLDASGKAGWEKNTMFNRGHTYSIVEILTERAGNPYKAFLRSKQISYIVAGDQDLDYALAMEKIYRLFGVKKLMLGGGGMINWSFLQAGMCDELSMVVTPAADGDSDAPTLFEARKMSGTDPIGFSFLNAEVFDGGVLWLRYKVNKKYTHLNEMGANNDFRTDRTSV